MNETILISCSIRDKHTSSNHIHRNQVLAFCIFLYLLSIFIILIILLQAENLLLDENLNIKIAGMIISQCMNNQNKYKAFFVVQVACLLKQSCQIYLAKTTFLVKKVYTSTQCLQVLLFSICVEISWYCTSQFLAETE